MPIADGRAGDNHGAPADRDRPRQAASGHPQASARVRVLHAGRRHRPLVPAQAAQSRQEVPRSEAFDVIFGLLDRIDECREDIVFFADEAGAWQVGVRCEKVLPPWLKVLSATAEPEEFAQRIVGPLKHHSTIMEAPGGLPWRGRSRHGRNDQRSPSLRRQQLLDAVTSDDGSTSCGSVRLR
jgi:hypothetical protein